MLENYKLYQDYLGPIPDFLYKYLELDILIRLKDISVLCGMDYASKHAYDFDFYISRYDHSLNVALITWKLTHDKKATLSALFHDVASPVFSHVIDYMNEDYIEQESTEEKTEEILKSSKRLKICLDIDGIDISDILDFKEYSIVDSKRPKMCADRIENIIGVGMSWIKTVDLEIAKDIIDNLSVVINEDGEKEISTNSKQLAYFVKQVNDAIDYLTHSNSDTYMMILTADIIKRCITLGLVTYDELFKIGEHDIINIIEQHIDEDEMLNRLWYLFKNIEEFPIINQPDIKKRNVNPLVHTKRLSECQ